MTAARRVKARGQVMSRMLGRKSTSSRLVLEFGEGRGELIWVRLTYSRGADGYDLP
jgi:hypothetical protein